MNKEDSFYIKELQPIREFCLHSDKEDVYKYIYSLQQKVNQLETNRDEAIEYINKLEDYPMLTRYNCLEFKSILERGKK